MTYLFKLSQRNARLRALALLASVSSLAACDTDRLTNSSEDPTSAEISEPFTSGPAFASSFRGGIPFGTYALPTSQFGETYNGGMRNIWPDQLISELSEIRRRGGRVLLTFAGKETHYLDGNGHFSLTLWKQRIEQFKSVDFSAFVEDGTVIGHYLIDEPNDAPNWGGKPVPGSMVETMAAYSKQLWPRLTTVVRVDPGYLVTTGGPYRYLDAAWAQYVSRKGTPSDYIRRNVADAQRLGIGLITGLNIIDGSPSGGEMSASQVESAGSTLLADSYPCAFFSWQWRDGYMFRSDIKTAMAALSRKAEAHAPRSCSSSSPTTPPPPPPPLPGISGIPLTAVRMLQDGDQVVNLTWRGASGSSVKLYVNGAFRRTTPNDGRAFAFPRRAGTFSYKICEAGSSRCSNTASVVIR